MENNIIKWLKARSTQEKWMLALIAMLLVGIVVRWAWVSSEVAGAFRERFTAPAEQVEPTNADPAEQVDNLPARAAGDGAPADPAEWVDSLLKE